MPTRRRVILLVYSHYTMEVAGTHLLHPGGLLRDHQSLKRLFFFSRADVRPSGSAVIMSSFFSLSSSLAARSSSFAAMISLDIFCFSSRFFSYLEASTPVHLGWLSKSGFLVAPIRIRHDSPRTVAGFSKWRFIVSRPGLG